MNNDLTIYDLVTFSQTYREKAQSRAAAYIDMHMNEGYSRDLVTAACFGQQPDNFQ